MNDIYAATRISPAALTVVLLFGTAILVVPRRKSYVAALSVSTFVTVGQQILAAGMNITMLRLVLLFCWVRLILRNEIPRTRGDAVTRTLLAWVVVRTAANALLWGTTAALVNRLGHAYDIIGTYLFFRAVVVDTNDARSLMRTCSFVILCLSAALLFERVTSRNPFFLLGGVPEFTVVRDGKLRCQGPFRHPILAGTVGAVTLPFHFVTTLSGKSRDRTLGLMGIAGSLLTVFLSSSSGPVLAVMFTLLSLGLWPLRGRLYIVRRAIVIGVVGLDAVMKAPIWFIFGRVSEIMGGTGYHRSALIDAAIAHFQEWALMGTTYTAHWMPYVLPLYPTMVDITNGYLAEGVDGGLLPMLLMITLIARAFRNVGIGLAFAHRHDVREEHVYWGLGCAVVAHMISMISVAYFDQISVYWYMLLGIIASVTPFEALGVSATPVVSVSTLAD